MSEEPEWHEVCRAMFRDDPNVTRTQLAEFFGVSKQTIWQVLTPRSIEPPPPAMEARK